MEFGDEFNFDNFDYVKSGFSLSNQKFSEPYFQNINPLNVKRPFFLNNEEFENLKGVKNYFFDEDETNSNATVSDLDNQFKIFDEEQPDGDGSVDGFGNLDIPTQVTPSQVFYYPIPPGVHYNEEILKIFVNLFFKYFPQCKTVYFNTKTRVYTFKKPGVNENYVVTNFSEKNFAFDDFCRNLLPSYKALFDFEVFYCFLRGIYLKNSQCRIKRYMIQIFPRFEEVLTEDNIYCKVRSKNKNKVYILNLYFYHKKNISVLCNLKKFEVINYISYKFVCKKKSKIKWILNSKKVNLEKNNILFVLLKIKK